MGGGGGDHDAVSAHKLAGGEDDAHGLALPSVRGGGEGGLGGGGVGVAVSATGVSAAAHTLVARDTLVARAQTLEGGHVPLHQCPAPHALPPHPLPPHPLPPLERNGGMGGGAGHRRGGGGGGGGGRVGEEALPELSDDEGGSVGGRFQVSMTEWERADAACKIKEEVSVRVWV